MRNSLSERRKWITEKHEWDIEDQEGTAMKAEEYKEEIYDLVDRMLETCDKKLIKHWDDIVWDRVCEISREIAVEFYISHVNNPIDKIYISKEFDDWLKK